ncbi:hypothetical protein KsCSTR_38250 [Candidatus Kuenenia stuttgartiensis]|jgi:hypothetical protein|uniref:Uncharacterized protein n=1 Tax=Kuenenia stuttgartiensis TaxID=174633 RepID=Q1Q5Z5_KUEST|nr:MULTISPECIES: hypothetical protein [Kuenenia]MBE7549314.1 hypothetical protein [Planctomycetia bacterium]MBW7943591.1 hypothetical protein [Candidatus Kuenenia stuttgartiensis]MBZ0191565.1 hypothetical protein [Candidatus Kuenenia stuttgartiensis]MCF6150819.1 hypothetical protein [Candidatus Kuenenia stuttgartiensis]MCL4727734.1 hypothetical protein [Candidatus Kuenenia stuttgartiensis]
MTKKFCSGIALFLIIATLGVFYQKYVKYPRCDYDGSPVTPIYEVEIVLKDSGIKRFCSIYCAVQWFKKNKHAVDHVIVTDEIRGNKIDSYMAHFVESELITNETNDNRIHVFQQREYAQIHMDKFNGRIVDDPFEPDE